MMTSWELLYRLLRDVFPDKLLHYERKMTSFEQKKDHIVVHFGENRKDEICDLLVGADRAGNNATPIASTCISTLCGICSLEDLLMRMKYPQKY